MGTGEFNAGGNPAMDWHPIQKPEISAGLMYHLALMQTLPLPYQAKIRPLRRIPRFI